MANLAEQNNWEAGIYQLETADPVMGGPNGIDNLQAKQLANRTVYLKALVDALNIGTGAGGTVPPGIATQTAVAQAVAAAIAPLAPLDTPVFTGNPQAPTPTAGDSSKSLATTEFVASATGAVAAPSQVAYFARQTAPAGWLKANGAAVSRTVYAALFAAIGTFYGAGDGSTTFNLPDLRGEFLRGWDDSRGADTGRAFGTYQAGAVQSHTHGVTDTGHAHGVNDPGHAHGVYDPGHSHSGGRDGGNTGAGPGWGSSYNAALSNQTNTGTSGTGVSIYGAGTGVGVNSATTGVAVQASGGAETRPRNVAMLACIKY